MAKQQHGRAVDASGSRRCERDVGSGRRVASVVGKFYITYTDWAVTGDQQYGITYTCRRYDPLADRGGEGRRVCWGAVKPNGAAADDMYHVLGELNCDRGLVIDGNIFAADKMTCKDSTRHQLQSAEANDASHDTRRRPLARIGQQVAQAGALCRRLCRQANLSLGLGQRRVDGASATTPRMPSSRVLWRGISTVSFRDGAALGSSAWLGGATATVKESSTATSAGDRDCPSMRRGASPEASHGGRKASRRRRKRHTGAKKRRTEANGVTPASCGCHNFGMTARKRRATCSNSAIPGAGALLRVSSVAHRRYLPTSVSMSGPMWKRLRRALDLNAHADE